MISEPDVKNRYSTPASPIAATIASLASLAWTSVHAPGAIVVATGPPPGFAHLGGEPLPSCPPGATRQPGGTPVPADILASPSPTPSIAQKSKRQVTDGGPHPKRTPR